MNALGLASARESPAVSLQVLGDSMPAEDLLTLRADHQRDGPGTDRRTSGHEIDIMAGTLWVYSPVIGVILGP